MKSQIIDAETGKVLLSSEIHLEPNANPQKLGSAITYFRRYTLKSLLAIAEGDDDANLASEPEPVKPVIVPKEKIVEMISKLKTKEVKPGLISWITYHKLTDELNAKLDTFKND